MTHRVRIALHTALLGLLALPGLAPAQETEAGAADTATIAVQSLPEPDSTPAAKEESAGPAVKLQAVEVTGSRIKRTDSETSQPVVRLSRKDLERSGSNSVGEILQALPAAGAALNTTFNNGGTGATEVDLRNLGSNRVLVLVDGHRWISGLRALSTNSVDLNTVPFAIVDRVDVLQDGASAAYGSDAVTGVVNIITRKKFRGLNLSAQQGVYEQGDGENGLLSLTGGTVFDGLFGGQSTSIAASLSVQNQADIFAGDREISRLPKVNTGLTRGSSFTPEGRFLFVGSPTTTPRFGADSCPGLAGGIAQGLIDDNGVPITLPSQLSQVPAGVNLCDITHVTGAPTGGAANYRPFDPINDPYNYALTNYLATPLRTYNAYLSLQHEFMDNLRFTAQGLYSLRQSKQQLAPQPIAFGDIAPVIGGLMPGSLLSYNQATYVTPGHSFNPTSVNGQLGQYIGHLDPNDPTNDPTSPAFLGLNYTGAVLRRMVEGGPRIQEQNVPTRFGRAGFEGSFSLFQQVIDWELGYSYGVSSQSQNLYNNYAMDRLQQAVVGNRGANDDNPYNVPLCVAPCVPINFFGGPGTITPEMLAFIRIDEHSNTRQSQGDLYLNLSTTLPVPLLADDLGVALGVERRYSHYSDNPSIYQINGTTSGLPAQRTEGVVIAREAFVELDLPLLKQLPLAQDLSLNLAGRVSDYDSFGTTQNGKIGGRWKPINDLLLRSSFSTSFRAPNPGELFLSNAGSYPALTDPCAAPEDGSVTATNCTADGVSPYTQTVAQYYSPFTGNTELQPETSHSLTAGLVINPRFLEGFDISADYFRIKVDNYITPPGAQLILDQCYTTTGRGFCEYISRNPSNGQLLSVLNSYQNFPSLETAGVDFNLNYQLPDLVPVLGRFKIAANATFLSSFTQMVASADGPQRDDSTRPGVLTLPRWKINPSLQWMKGAYSGSLNTRIIWGVTEGCDDGITPSLSDLGLCSNPDNRDRFGNPDPQNRVHYAWKTDLQLGYNAKAERAQFTLGVQNLFDRDPPIAYSAFANSFDPSYWVPGRFFYAGIKKDF